MEKNEYIKQLKRLIKKYHPDLCEDANLEAAHNEITKKLIGILNAVKTNKIPVIKIQENDYMFYKLGIKYYKNIHPDVFYKNISNGNYETKQYDELVEVLNNIFLSFNLSEYYFKKVIEKYPQSFYAASAKEKIELLKKLYARYENIVIEENQTTNYTQYVTAMGLKI